MRMELSHKTQTATETLVIEYSPNDKEAAEAASSRINVWLDRVYGKETFSNWPGATIVPCEISTSHSNNGGNITTGTIRFDAFNANKESFTYV